MSKQNDALKLALEALEADPLEMVADVDGHMVFLKDKAITAIKEHLKEKALQALHDENERLGLYKDAYAEQEPVAWGVFDHNLHDMFFAKEEAHEMVRLKGDGSTVKPLYATPPQRTWVGLTEDEAFACKGRDYFETYKAIEAKLKDKNT